MKPMKIQNFPQLLSLYLHLTGFLLQNENKQKKTRKIFCFFLFAYTTFLISYKIKIFKIWPYLSLYLILLDKKKKHFFT